MNHFSETSKQRLLTCHKDLQIIFAHVIIDYDCTIVCGHREKEDQDKAFAQGLSTKQYPNSKHNKIPSLAVDAAPYEKGTGVDWKPRQMAFFAGYVKGIADQLYRIGTISHRIRLGIDWDGDEDIDDEKFIDAPHFELVLNERDIQTHH
jgi:peptidoglycan L-alanyl-D-glutamate endopeptidase CwlK